MSNPSEVNLNSLGVMGIKTERAGPRLLVLGAVHGNETCGPRAIERVMADFDSEKLQLVRGNVTFVPITNPLAYQRGQRIGERNLNRNLRVTTEPKDYEDRIANALCPLIGQHDAVLDLHSFQSPGEPFAMIGPTTNEDDLEPFAFSMPEEALALRLGVRRFVHGWMPTYAAGVANRIKRADESGLPDARAQLLNTDPSYGIGTTEYIRSVGGLGITVECGQHDDPKAVDVAYQAIVNTMTHLRMVAGPHIEPRTDVEVLCLSEVTDRLHADDAFVRPWASFDKVSAGEPIGRRHDGSVVSAPADGYIVFPNTTALPGNEWFYFAQLSTRTLNSD